MAKNLRVFFQSMMRVWAEMSDTLLGRCALKKTYMTLWSFWRLVIYGHLKLTLNIVVEETSSQFQLLFGTFLGFQWMGDGVLLGCSKTGCHATNKPSFFDTIDYHRMSPSFAAAMKKKTWGTACHRSGWILYTRFTSGFRCVRHRETLMTTSLKMILRLPYSRSVNW